ncbi:CbtB domain-containing protein [Natronomonas sp.]|uniref:CbtB domain-containing protein n=1 Tax=Natronomonas sp. TaxID=2184060 RepID=UPI00262B1A91|nr:CbtB domain-containing protein [Natronomonas sp.]
MTANDTVSDRFELASGRLNATRLAAGLLFGAAIAAALLFAQEPLVHDAAHNFRHAAGVVCH